MRLDRESLLLYAVTDRRWLKPGETLTGKTEEAIDGGATFVQLREKNLDEESFLREGMILKELCKRRNVPFVINDNVELAVKIDADGVHVGQEDMEASEVRRIVGWDKIIGVSAQTVEQAVMAEKHGADYIGVGAVFSTGSKDDAAEVTLEALKAICAAVKIPVIAIGGITEENVRELSGSGICGIAVISALYGKENVRSAAERLKINTMAAVK